MASSASPLEASSACRLDSPAATPDRLSRTVFAQDTPSPTQGLVRKGKVPVSDEILKITFPRPAEATLSNGLRLLVLEDRRLPQVSFQLLIPGAGGYADPPDQPGLAVVHRHVDARRHGDADVQPDRPATRDHGGDAQHRRRQLAGSDDCRLVPQRPGRER